MSIHVYKKQNNSPKKKAINLVSYITLIIGCLLLFWSFYPIISFEVYSRFFLKSNINEPVNTNDKNYLSQASSVLGAFNIFSNNLRDFGHASIWFPERPQANLLNSVNVKEYLLSIPKLNIKDAKVMVGGEDLTEYLVHYLPKSLPGEVGNVVIFGHSTLPQMYNVKDYKTIFTYLPSLDNNDIIRIKIGELEYQYEVINSYVIDPKEVSVLDQDKSGSYLTLITCVPPGTYWKRLVIKAKLKLI